MTELQQNRYDQLLRRVGDLKGPGSKVNDALTELFPMIDVENVPAELLALSGARLCAGNMFIDAGGPTFFSIALLRNNAGTGVIGRLIEISVTSVTQNIALGPTLNSDAALGTRAFIDGRLFGEGTVLVTQGNNNSLVVGSIFYAINTGLEGTVIYHPPAAIGIITPGTAFSVSAGTVDTAINVSFLWLERVAQPSELNL